MMRLLVDVLDAAGTVIGDGPIVTAKSVSVSRKLDGAGNVSLEFPATDARVASLLQNKRRARVWLDPQDGTEMREMARMIIEKNRLRQSSTGHARSVSGPDLLGELTFVNVRRGRKYNAATVSDIVSDLLGLTNGWLLSGEAAGVVSARFDGASVLKALIGLVERQGIHFRQNPIRTLEIGRFGTPSGLTILNRQTAPGMDMDENVLLVDNLTLEEDSEDLFNWLEPVGAGEGDAAATLEKAMATRSTALGYAYDIQTETGPDGRTIYYLRDQDSVDLYGQIEKVGEFKDITPVGTSAADQIAIAEALYDAAAATLLRFKDPYVAYSLSCRMPKIAINPGDKIRLRDQFSIVDDNGDLVNVVDMDADFWVMEVTETVSASGSGLRLKIASVDRVEMDEAEVVVGMMESVHVANLSVKPYFTKDSWWDSFDIDATHPVTFTINVTPRTQSMQICTLRIMTMPFRSNAKNAPASTAAAGGDHTHIMFSAPAAAGGTGPWGTMSCADPDGGVITVETRFTGSVPTTKQLVTYGASGNHTHSIPAAPLDYGIYDDNQYPSGVQITVNSQVIASNLDAGGSGLNQTFDITEAITGAPVLQQPHSIVITCTGGQGRVKVFVEQFETIQSVSVYS